MDFALSEEQQMLKSMLCKFLDNDWSFKILRDLEENKKTLDAGTYKQLVEMGLTGITIPEEYGGTGGNLLDEVIVLEELGRMLVPSPLIDTALASAILLRFSPEKEGFELLSQLATGERLVTCLFSQNLLKSIDSGKNVTLSGVINQVPFWQDSNWLLIIDTDQEEIKFNLVLVDKKSLSTVVASPVTTMDGQILHNLDFGGAEYLALLVISGVDRGEVGAVLAQAKILAAAEAVGGAQGALNIAVQYATERVQFGQPIGSFQAIQHRLADVAIALEQARTLTYYAASLVEKGEPAIAEAAMAKLLAGQAFRQAAVTGAIVMGGYGFMMEYDMQLYYRRIKQKEFAFNLPHEEVEIIINEAEREGNYDSLLV